MYCEGRSVAPVSSKSAGTIFPAACACFCVSVSHCSNSHNISVFFIVMFIYSDLWAVILDIIAKEHAEGSGDG